MRIVLASTFVPFVNGGARFIVEWLEDRLKAHGHAVERFYLPFVDDPTQMVAQTMALRLMDLSESADRLIAFRPPSYVLPHPNKVLWFIHHIRAYYDLWDSAFGPPHTPEQSAMRQALHRLDTRALAEARHIYTNSRIVADRLERFNGLAAEPLYPPILQPERFFNRSYGDEIVAVCRLEPHKRQHLLIEAMRHTRSGVKLRLCGRSAQAAYGERLSALVADYGLADKVIIEERWISEAEKAERLADALAVVYAPEDEDSYGYPSLEAAHAEKAVVTARDAGGVLELVEDGRNGFVCEPEPAAIAAAFDALHRDRAAARRMGLGNRERAASLRIDWDHVITALTR